MQYCGIYGNMQWFENISLCILCWINQSWVLSRYFGNGVVKNCHFQLSVRLRFELSVSQIWNQSTTDNDYFSISALSHFVRAMMESGHWNASALLLNKWIEVPWRSCDATIIMLIHPWYLSNGLSQWWLQIRVGVHDDVIKWKHTPRYWPFVRGIHRWIPYTKASDAELWYFLWSTPK